MSIKEEEHEINNLSKPALIKTTIGSALCCPFCCLFQQHKASVVNITSGFVSSHLKTKCFFLGSEILASPEQSREDLVQKKR